MRRVLGLAGSLPGLRRMDLTVNYRCPAGVVERAVRLVAHNGERFVKTIRAGPVAEGRLVLAPDGSDDAVRVRRVLETWPDDGRTRAILARTNAELLPAAAVAVEMGLAFRAPRLRLLSEDPRVEALLRTAVATGCDETLPLLPRLAALARSDLELFDSLPDPRPAPLPAPLPAPPRPAPSTAAQEPDRRDSDEQLPIETRDLLAALIGWAAPYRSLSELAVVVDHHRARVVELRRDDALLTLATAHSTKGLEFDHVAVVGLDAGRFPSGRSLREAAEPERALEEERRLAYVAWTRAHRSLTLVYDPAVPSPFMLEAFDAGELGLDDRGR
ncbi:MAG: 3'-5' exonuclease [Candidatus Limnocylindrales bacterium]